ncbi:tRNA epoxyqueuosine(34) reductase QueG [Terriglobus saanensis]|nr:tRNA epoxyqueuosine(34) reductase QueG [Terriglobus saanensis]
MAELVQPVIEPSVSLLDESMRARIVARSLEAGFHAAAIAPAPESGSEGERLLRERFLAFIAQGRGAEMHYLQRADEQGNMLRTSIHTAFPWARSVVLCAFNYNAAASRSIDPAGKSEGWIARYAWSGDGEKATDYHNVLLAKLRAVEQTIQDAAPGVQTRSYVDTGPLVERHFAQLAGLGWIGKNTCVMSQELGSWLLLGVIVTSLEVQSGAVLGPAADRCGSCTRCIDACPTDALIAPRQMDAGRCIAYLTIEKKGSIPEEMRAPMGRQIFGCDICQDVCPWNRKSPVGGDEGMHARDELINPSLHWIAEMGNAEFRAHFRGSPLERTGRKRLHRNTAIAMGNSGDVTFLPKLKEWAAGDDVVLAETATWAIAEIQRKSSEGLLC